MPRLQRTGAVVAGASLAGLDPRVALAAGGAERTTPSADRIGWRVAVQWCTFHEISCCDALEKIAAVGVRQVEPGFFLRRDSERPALQTNENLSSGLR